MAKKYVLRGETADLKSVAEELQNLTLSEEGKGSDLVRVAPAARRKSHAKLVLIATLSAIVVLVAGVLLFTKGLSSPGAVKFAVPRVVGQEAQAAVAAVRQARLRAVIEYAPAHTEKAGTVISTKPAAGTRLGDGDTVILVVAGEAETPTPTPAPEETPAATTPAGPDAPKAATPASETMSIFVGPVTQETATATDTAAAAAKDEKVAVPDIEGMVDTRARAKLEELGLQVEIAAGEDGAMPPGVVLASDPKPGTRVDKGASVRLSINTPRQQAAPAGNLERVKSYAGASAEAASQDLKSLGLTAVIVHEATRVHRAGTVIRTNPPAGSHLPRGSQVTLYVAR